VGYIGGCGAPSNGAGTGRPGYSSNTRGWQRECGGQAAPGCVDACGWALAGLVQADGESSFIAIPSGQGPALVLRRRRSIQAFGKYVYRLIDSSDASDR